jgi:hypothetical protein
MNVYHGGQGRSPFVRDPDIDIIGIQIKEGFRYLLKGRGSVSIDSSFEPGYPCIVRKVSIFEIMVRMVMGDENVFQSRKVNTSKNQLPADTSSTINDVRNVIHKYDPC